MGLGLYIVVLIFGILVGAFLMFGFYKKDVEICDRVGNKLYISFWGKESMGLIFMKKMLSSTMG